MTASSAPAFPTDLLHNEFTAEERKILAVYEQLKELVAEDLPPTAAANLRDALASVSIVVTGLALDFEHLLDHGI